MGDAKSEPPNRISGGETGVDSRAERLLTVEEVAEWLRLTTKGVYAMVEARRIPFFRVSNRLRFSRLALSNWLEGNRVSALEERQ
ncbi:MAG: helix-turn-helix domain-containing protein [Proteobacteria bacterium]|jgi:excisionase family DNA binding protein|nr:helix-turn-helix domain-containing protein [Pseudomonadota bacterium]